jgi:hypothetical protein
MLLGLGRELTQLEEVLNSRRADFSGLYLAVSDLHAFVKEHPERAGIGTIRLLQGVLEDQRHRSQKQALVLYREAAGALTTLVVLESAPKPVAEMAMAVLRKALGQRSTPCLRAVAEALGALPLPIRGPALAVASADGLPQVSWGALLERQGIPTDRAPDIMGRSLVVPLSASDHLLVVKLATARDSPQTMAQETLWMELLRAEGDLLPVHFDIPIPIRVHGTHVFRLKDLPVCLGPDRSPHPQRYAIGFSAHRDYFVYINGCRRETGLSADSFAHALCGSAWLLGWLAARGIVHGAPIPLFHNRVQRLRRSDHGLYEWPRGGRLDRWLTSCRYPNFGLTGLRDFEHFLSIQGAGTQLYQQIGGHLLSLLLVAGSYFRNQDALRGGWDEQGQPVDARGLFDPVLLKGLVEGILRRYYRGFVGAEFPGEVPMDCHGLVRRMIDEMGVDRHMEEILRIADQETMSDEEFRDFLISRGISHEQAEGMQRGVEDVVVHTGPHLGAFNNRISLPELTELVATGAALCIAGRFWMARSAR